MEGKYMLMKGPDGPFTVPLLAKDNKLMVTVGVHEVQLTASIERLFVYDLHVGAGKGEVVKWLREVAKISVAPMMYDAFISGFLDSHPKTPAPAYSYELIPMQADERLGLDLPIPHYCCTISPDAERELMRLYIETRSDKVYNVIVEWFRAYCKDYGYDFRKCKGAQYEYLYYAFLEQHGIYRYSIKEKTIEEEAEYYAYKNNLPKQKRRKVWRCLFKSLILLLGYTLTMWLLWLGLDRINVADNMLGWFGCALAFFCLLGVLFSLIFPFYNAEQSLDLWTIIKKWITD